MSPRAIHRMETMLAETVASGRRLDRWRVSPDIYDELRADAKFAMKVRIMGDIDRVLGIPIVWDTSLPPNSIILEPR